MKQFVIINFLVALLTMGDVHATTRQECWSHACYDYAMNVCIRAQPWRGNLMRSITIGARRCRSKLTRQCRRDGTQVMVCPSPGYSPPTELPDDWTFPSPPWPWPIDLEF